jgi:hypothetical protein
MAGIYDPTPIANQLPPHWSIAPKQPPLQAGVMSPVPMAQQQPLQQAPAIESDFWRAAVGSFIGGNPKTGGDAMDGFGAIMGNQWMRDTGRSIAKYGEKELKKYEPRVKSFTDIKSGQDLVDYIQSSSGSAIGSTAPSLAAGGAGFLAAGPAGAAVGALGPSYIQNYGDVWAAVRDDPEVRKSGKSEQQLASIAAAASVPIAALDALSAGGIVSKQFLGDLKKSVAKKIITGLVTGAISEGSTEALQATTREALVASLGDNPDLLNRAIRVADEGIAGALGGAPMGAATAPSGAEYAAGMDKAQQWMTGSEPGVTMGTFIGGKSNLTDEQKKNLELAKAYEFKEYTPEVEKEMWKRFGWGKTAEGDWMTEISDFGAKLDTKKIISGAKKNSVKGPFGGTFGAPDSYGPYKLGEIYDHPKLYEAHPELKDLEVRDVPKTWPVEVLAGYTPPMRGEPGFINLRFDALTPEGQRERYVITGKKANLKSDLQHELQHVVSRLNEWGSGSSPNILAQRMQETAIIQILRDHSDFRRLVSAIEDQDRASAQALSERIDPQVLVAGVEMFEALGLRPTLDNLELVADTAAREERLLRQFTGENNAYYNVTDEVRARNTAEGRLSMDDYERRNIAPYETQSTPVGGKQLHVDFNKEGRGSILDVVPSHVAEPPDPPKFKKSYGPILSGGPTMESRSYRPPVDEQGRYTDPPGTLGPDGMQVVSPSLRARPGTLRSTLPRDDYPAKDDHDQHLLDTYLDDEMYESLFAPHMDKGYDRNVARRPDPKTRRAYFGAGRYKDVADFSLSDDGPMMASSAIATDQEYNAIDNYTSVGSGPINSWLRRGEGEKEPSQIRWMDEFFNKNSLDGEQVVYRVISSDRFDRLHGMVGSRFRDKGYMSTTSSDPDEGGHLQYLDQDRPGGTKTIKIHLPYGARAADVSSISNMGNEQEVLIDRGSVFRVEADEKGNPYLVYEETVKDREPDRPVFYQMAPLSERLKWIPGAAEVRGKPGEGYSDGAYEEGGWIHTNDPEDAIRALLEDRLVVLDQPQTAAVAIGKLAEGVEKLKENPKQVMNLANVMIKGTSLFGLQNKGLPRIRMPQLKGPAQPGSRAAVYLKPDARGETDIAPKFLEYLVEQGYKVEKAKRHAAYLKPTQNELNGEKIAAISKFYAQGKLDPQILFVSHDNYILDGHHRWAAILAEDIKDGNYNHQVDVAQVDADILELIDEANAFAQEWGIPQAGAGQFVKFDFDAPKAMTKIEDKKGPPQAAVALNMAPRPGPDGEGNYEQRGTWDDVRAKVGDFSIREQQSPSPWNGSIDPEVDETPEFKKWFGDSIITDTGEAGGRPLVVYHGWKDIGELGNVFRNWKAPTEDENSRSSSGGFYFTPSAHLAAENYAGNRLPVPAYLSVKNPWVEGVSPPIFFRVKNDQVEIIEPNEETDKYERQGFAEGIQAVSMSSYMTKTKARALKAAGYDAAIGQHAGSSDLEIFVLDPRQVKSATKNSGAFNPESTNMYESRKLDRSPDSMEGLTTQPDRFSPDEERAIESWRDYEEFEEWNREMREGDWEIDYDTVPHLVSAIDKSRLTRDLVLHRGVSSAEDNFGRNPGEKFLKGELETLKPGDIYIDYGFMATSIGPGAASDFGPKGTGLEGAMLTIHAPKGTKGLNPRSYHGEIVLQRGTKFQLIEKKPGNYIFRVVGVLDD